MMGFMGAIGAVRRGQPVTREAWEPSGCSLVWHPGYPDGTAVDAIVARITGLPEGSTVYVRPYLVLVDPRGWLCPYTPTQQDLGASDWLCDRQNVDTGRV